MLLPDSPERQGVIVSERTWAEASVEMVFEAKSNQIRYSFQSSSRTSRCELHSRREPPPAVDPIMLIIPPEIYLSIIDHAEPPALRALRATSRTLCVLATPQAFRVLSCTGTERSTFCINQLMARPLVADQVQEIDYSCENTDSADLPDILSDSPLHDLRHLPSLHTLAYTFPRNISSDPLINSLVHLQRDALTALNDTIPASLRSLTLRNIAPYHVICPNADRIFTPRTQSGGMKATHATSFSL
ncbi:hypothetical protein FA95DRAFT_441510 [Auriscalpium vulgare]|uniref:Uncharacterized protein n=1 Tax=Auriscalpium vulgare TaxID=40419 RepID=A0ACB8RG49_9AGAM|nr:hypothetical protein FA95DRAFT_441510 [Auriscalpium vulgare]